MNTAVFRFSFAPGVDMTEVEATLQLAILASEGLFGEARVRMEVSYHADVPRSIIVVDGCTAPGDAAVRIFAAFLTREFGADAFTVRAIPTPKPQPVAVSAA